MGDKHQRELDTWIIIMFLIILTWAVVMVRIVIDKGGDTHTTHNIQPPTPASPMDIRIEDIGFKHCSCDSGTWCLNDEDYMNLVVLMSARREQW